MYTNFDEMDIEPNSDPAGIRKSSPLLADSVLTKVNTQKDFFS